MIIDYKKRFKDSPHRKPWHEATESDWFQTAIQTALLEMPKTLGKATEMGVAAANNFKLEGARDFVNILLNLTETTPEPKPRYQQNLDNNT